MFQTNLYVTYKKQPHDFANPYVFTDVHPDSTYKIENGMLSFETLDGEAIIYIPADTILFFHTTCERVS